jgi:exoribonuclease R
MKFYDDYVQKTNTTTNTTTNTKTNTTTNTTTNTNTKTNTNTILYEQQLNIVNRYKYGVINTIINDNDANVFIVNTIDLNRCFDGDIVDVEIYSNLSSSTFKKIDKHVLNTINNNPNHISIKKTLTKDNENEDEINEEDGLFGVFDVDTIVSNINATEQIYFGKIINKYVENNLFLTGMLNIKSKYSYGINKQGNPMYKFYPNNNKYPSFYVASNYLKKNKQKTNDVYVYVKYKEWLTTSKFPIGTCEQVIGEIGNIEAEYNQLLYEHKLINKSYRNIELSEKELTTISLINKINNQVEDIKTIGEIKIIVDKFLTINNMTDRVNCVNDYMFSIDPDGCTDIDDVIGINNNEISIHISDVSHFIEEGSVLDKQAYMRGSSVYAPHKQMNMIPDDLSTNICSLLPKKIRFASTVIIEFDDEHNIIGHRLQKSVMCSQEAMTYDLATELLRMKLVYPSDLKRSKSKCLSFGCAIDNLVRMHDFVKKNNILDYEILDTNPNSHMVIDTLMVLANSIIAQELFNHSRNNNNIVPFLRSHGTNIKAQVKEKKLFINDNQNTNKLYDFLNICSIKSASYIVAQSESNDTYHSGLNIQYYTHFTSPIRRYFDIIVHRQLYKIIEYNNNKEQKQKQEQGQKQEQERSNINEQLLCNKLNMVNSNIKKCERDFQKIRILFEDGKKYNKKNINAFIININSFNKAIQIYIPDLEITHTFNLFSNKLSHLLTYDICQRKINNENLNDKMIITNIHTKELISLQLYQSIKIDIIEFMNKDFKNKWHIKIIAPDTNRMTL